MSAIQSGTDLRFLWSPSARRRFSVLTGALVLGALLYVAFAPRWYRSSVTLLPGGSQDLKALKRLSGGLEGPLAAAAARLGEGPEMYRAAAVLQSVAVSDAVISRFDLKAQYGEQDAEAVRESLWRRCAVRALVVPGLVRVSCEDRSPARAQAMVAYFAETANRALRHLKVSSAAEEVAFLSGRAGELTRQADDAAARLREVEEERGLVDVDAQSRSVVSALAALERARIQKDLELGYESAFASREAASRRQLESQRSAIVKAERMLEEGPLGDGPRTAAPPDRAVFPPALQLPGVRLELEAARRERRLAERLLLRARGRLEAARTDRDAAASPLSVLDPPTVATLQAWPRPGLTVGLALVVGMALAMASEVLRHVASAPAEERTPEQRVAPGPAASTEPASCH